MQSRADRSGTCPNCGSRITGRIGADRYYCRDCYVEYETDTGNFFAIDDEGNLVSMREDQG